MYFYSCFHHSSLGFNSCVNEELDEESRKSSFPTLLKDFLQILYYSDSYYSMSFLNTLLAQHAGNTLVSFLFFSHIRLFSASGFCVSWNSRCASSSLSTRTRLKCHLFRKTLLSPPSLNDTMPFLRHHRTDCYLKSPEFCISYLSIS